MLSEERRDRIMSIIREKKRVTVTELSQHFSVSGETIRRDFDIMERNGLVKKIYGGAVIKNSVTINAPRKILTSLFQQEKRRIAHAAAKQIRPGECIFLDHSTTVYEMCQFIDDIPLTVITNSLSIMVYFAEKKQVRLVCPGGNYNADLDGFQGFETIRYLKTHSFDKSFLSCKTVDKKMGLCEADENVSETKKTVLNNSREVFLLADHTKLDRNAFVSYAPLKAINCIITDIQLNQSWKEFLKESHIQYIECPE